MRNVFLWIIVFLLIILLIFLLWWFFIRNQPPEAFENIFTTVAETAVTENIIIDDNDPEMEPLTLDTTPVVRPMNGTVQLVATGMMTYTPNAGFSGVDLFRYRVCDSGNKCDQANVVITVRPVAVADVFNTSKNTAVSGNVLVNDKGTSLEATPQSTANLVLQPNGDFTYTPAPDSMAPETFTYEVCDAALTCATGTVTIQIVDWEVVPDSYSTPKNTPLIGNVHDNDSPTALPVDTTPVTSPTNGTVTIEAGGVFTYTPNADYVGLDNFTYRVCVSSVCQSADVSIDVTDGPIAENDVFITYLNNAAVDNVLINDVGDGLAVNLTVSPSNGPISGTAEFQTDGTLIYQPNLGFTGSDEFTYEVCDSNGICDQALVTVEVGAPPDTLLHTVEQGDWLIQIARCYGTSVHAIRYRNHLYNPHYLRPGQVLVIPHVNSQGIFTGPPCVHRYFVKFGDTTASIAAAYGISEAELRRVNGIPYPNGYYLRVGQLLVVPRPVPGYMLP